MASAGDSVTAPPPSFLRNLQSIYAHTDEAPFTATFEHQILGPANGIWSDCLWYPPKIPTFSPSRPGSPYGYRSDDSGTVLRAEDVSPPSDSLLLGVPTQSQGRNGSVEDDNIPSRDSESFVRLSGDDSSLPDYDSESGGPKPEISVLLFIPGNPGLIAFYTDFLNHIHASRPSLGILANAHLGQSPRMKDLAQNPSNQGAGKMSIRAAGLDIQIESAIEVYDAIVKEYSDMGIRCKVILTGHSVGGWIVTQIMKARPGAVDGAYLLFPTLSEIASTPNGRRLKRIFSLPAAYLLATLSFILLVVLPSSLLLTILERIFPHFPRRQVYVARSLIRSPRTIFSALRMARDEMRVIGKLGLRSSGFDQTGESVRDTLQRERDKIWVYYGEGDAWVLERGQEEVYRVLKERRPVANESTDHITGSISRNRGEIVFGSGVPHDFCIDMKHSEIIGQQCVEWLDQGGFV